MQIKILQYNEFQCWKEKIAKFIEESNEINFPSSIISSSYVEERCDLLRNCLVDKSAIVFLAVEKDELIGWVWCYKINRFEDVRLHITEFFVVALYRGHGVGHQLLAKTETYAKEKKINAIDLLVTLSNDSAVNFYSHNGFETERLQLIRKP